MKCPVCQSELQGQQYHHVPIEKCLQGCGLWLTPGELDELENTAFHDIEDNKGTMIAHPTHSDRDCPECGEKMQKFNYHYYNLELDGCVNQHGFWLDNGEEQRVLDLMKQEMKNWQKACSEEQEWAKMLNKFRAQSLRFFQKSGMR